MTSILKYTTVFLLILSGLTGFSQDPKLSRKSGNKELRKSQFELALENFLSIDSSNLSEDDYYNIGLCYYNIPRKRHLGIPYFEGYLSKTDTLSVVYYFLGNLYHENYQFDQAIDQYNTFRTRLERDYKQRIIQEEVFNEIFGNLERNIQYCKNGKVMLDNPREVVIENLGDSVNTLYNEYAPVVSYNEELLYYTARRPENSKGKIAPDGDFYEDIYQTTLLDGSLFDEKLYRQIMEQSVFFSLITPLIYSEGVQLKGEINSEGHDASVLISKDGKKLYFYRDSHIWTAEKTENGFGNLTMLTDETNSGVYEPSKVISYKEDIRFISSEREGGYGGLDIYYSKKQADSSWGPFVNLGENVNTEFDDDVSYFDERTHTLYFSSKGHSGMGGYDVFKSLLRDKEWSAAMNLGYPVNTPFDDVFFSMTHRYNRGYFASSRPSGFGGLDLYRLTFANERSPLAEIKGLVLKGDSLLPGFSKMTMLDVSEKAIVQQESDSLTGDYLMLLPHGKEYTMLVETEGFIPYTCKFIVPPQMEYFQLYQEIHHVHLYDNEGNIIGQKVSLHNAFFEGGTDLGTDTLTIMFNDNDSLYSKYKDRVEGQTGYKMYSNVKFYMTQDSLSKLMATSDPKLEFDFPDNSTFSFLKDSTGADYHLLNDYEESNITSINFVDGNIVIVNDIENKDSLITELEQVKKEEFPKIIVYFDFNSTTLNITDELEFFSKYLLKNEEINFTIVGHTDNMGSDKFNQRFGLQRAKIIQKYLIKEGVGKQRLQVESKGESDPIAPNQNKDGSDNPEGRKLNRRVEFIIQP